MSTIFLSRARYTPRKRFVYYSDHGTTVSEVEGTLCPRETTDALRSVPRETGRCNHSP